jgi:hypothetical protein
MDNRGVKSLTFHKLLHFKEADVVLIQELINKAHTSLIPQWAQTHPPSLLTDLNIIQYHPFQIAVLIQFNRWSKIRSNWQSQRARFVMKWLKELR